MNAPSAFEITAARAAAELTQADAAALLFVEARTWQRWEAGERGMLPALFELFLLKTKQRTIAQAIRGDV